MRHKRVTPAVPLTDRLAVTVGEAQILLGGVSRDTIYNLINAGHLVISKIGKRTLIHTSSLRMVLEQTVSKPKPRVRRIR